MKREAKESSTHSSKQNKSKHVRKSTLERRKQSLRRRFVEESQRIALPAGIHEKRIIYQRKKLSLSLSSRGCRGEGWATTCARVISIKVAPFATLKSPLSPDCSPMEQRRGRHLLAGVELLPFSPKVEHLRNVFAGGPHCRMPAMRTEVQITGLRKEGDFSHDPIFNDDHGPRHDDQRRAGRETREGRGRGEGEKKESDRGEWWRLNEGTRWIRLWMIVKGG